MKRLTTLLWAIDKLEIGNIGARNYITFEIPATKSRGPIIFREESYGDMNLLLDKAIECMCKYDPIAKSAWENKNR